MRRIRRINKTHAECMKCGRFLPIRAFYWHKRHQLPCSECKNCMKAYERAHNQECNLTRRCRTAGYRYGRKGIYYYIKTPFYEEGNTTRLGKIMDIIVTYQNSTGTRIGCDSLAELAGVKTNRIRSILERGLAYGYIYRYAGDKPNYICPKCGNSFGVPIVR